MSRFTWFLSLFTALLPLAAQQFPPDLYAGLKWRTIGPFRGGRTVAAAGIPAQPNIFYIAAMLLVNKPLEWTSFDVVNKLRKKLKIKKIGHAGTLDPLATGLLIICTGKFTKQIDSYQALEKEYTGTFILGQTTPSHDLETEISDPISVAHLTPDQLESCRRKFLGTISQIPPLHSAIKIDGKRAYKFARKGVEKELKPREVLITEFEWRVELPLIHFRVVCSKGTYIRSLARDIGSELGVGAYLSSLCRTRIGEFKLENASNLELIE